MSEPVTLSLIAALSVMAGSTISFAFNFFLKKSEYRKENFQDFLHFRINAHDNIVKPLYESKQHCNIIQKVVKERTVDSEPVSYGKGKLDLEKDKKKIDVSLRDNSLWAHVDLLNLVGIYMNLLSQIDESMKKKEYSNAEKLFDSIDKSFATLMAISRKYSGVDFLNREMEVLASSKIVCK